jgi:hypothetical protein
MVLPALSPWFDTSGHVGSRAGAEGGRRGDAVTRAAVPPRASFDQLGALREAYQAFVIVHVPGKPWYALPIWSLDTRLEAHTADRLRDRMDKLLKASPVSASGGRAADAWLASSRRT